MRTFTSVPCAALRTASATKGLPAQTSWNRGSASTQSAGSSASSHAQKPIR